MPFSEKVKEEVLSKANIRCCICRSHPATHVHHIIPQKDGGPDTEDNAAPLCPNCHDTYGGNPEKRKFIIRNRNDWYEICEQPSSAEVEQIQEMLDKFGKHVATKEDIQEAVSYLDNRIQKIMIQPLPTSEQLQLISDATAAFSIATTSASIKPIVASNFVNSKHIMHVCEDCGYSFDCNNEKCPKCGYPKG